MENPRLVNRFFFGVGIAILMTSLLWAVLTHDAHPFLWSLAVLIAFVLICGAAALLNLAIFPPIFSLLARLTGKPRVKHPESRDDHAA
jgi:hypothetical protein